MSNRFKRFLANKKRFKSSPKKTISKRKRIVVRQQDPFAFIEREVQLHKQITSSFPSHDTGIRDTFGSAERFMVGANNEALDMERLSAEAIPDDI